MCLVDTTINVGIVCYTRSSSFPSIALDLQKGHKCREWSYTGQIDRLREVELTCRQVLDGYAHCQEETKNMMNEHIALLSNKR